ncbi:hypothetical protein CPB84DRAFT_1842061 [Gymnopilus junonius]|uniref:Uncharacterized protein n=1 Tax=Gymnopilus junonius TaxID=109634 RepID=A0A9P5TUJ3_GYMJU|nr:hypothetical protein CPB84DRAFT_1842061 [Gymnopilus junonius]
MARAWTKEKISDFRQEKKAALAAQRAVLLKTTQATLKSTAWSLGRYPLASFIAPCSGTLERPRHLYAATECDHLKFKLGDNLNLLTYQHYDEVVDPKLYPTSNFVTDTAVQPKRHEYLGPSPTVAGYRFIQGRAEIIFWDDYLKTMWIKKGRWDIELEFDSKVESWFVIGFM